MSLVEPVPVQNGYISLPLSVDPDAILQGAILAIASAFPGWVPQEGQLEVAILEQFAEMASESAIVAGSTSLAIFQYFGQQLMNLPPEAGAAAEATTTWTMIDESGYTVPAGTVVAYQTAGNVQVQFETVSDFTVEPGGSSIDGVTIAAQVLGSANNGISDSTTISPVTQLAFVASVTAVGPTAGGVDPETISAYNDRLSNVLQLLTPRPILANDFAALASNVPGVYRATAINLLNPGRTISGTISGSSSSSTLTDSAGSFTANDVGRTVSGTDIYSGASISAYVSATEVTLSHDPTGTITDGTVTLSDLTDVERCVCVAAVDVDGNTLSSDIEADLSTYLESMREVNFLVPVIGPTYTEIDVTWQGVAQVGQNATTVEDAGNAAVSAFLSQANWGTDSVSIVGTVTTDSDEIPDIVIPTDDNGNPYFALQTGVPVSGYGIPSNTTIASVSGNTVTLSNDATASGTALLNVVLEGTWDSSMTTVRYLQVVSILGQTPGLDHLTEVEIAVHGDALGTSDIDLSGDAPLTQTGTISGSVSAHP